ncbi:MAG: tetratricopeptide repeat protein [Candidatus Kariarchaeaceae archaeon]|jgi:tetratricopeptide (TPR) repeat protein
MLTAIQVMAMARSQDTSIKYHHQMIEELEDPLDWDAWAKETEYLLGRQFEYRSELETTDATDQELFDSYSGLGCINAKLGLYSQAINSYDKARRYSYNKANTWKNLEQLFVKEGNEMLSMSLDQLFDYYQLDHTSPITWVGLGVKLDQNKLYDRAKLCFREAKTLDKTCCDAWKGLYQVNKRMGNQREALRAFGIVKEFFNPV